MSDDFDERELGDALRRRAERIAGPSADPAAAIDGVRRRARRRRTGRAAAVGLVAAAAIAGVAGRVILLSGEGDVLRTPATAPATAPTTGATTVSTVPATSPATTIASAMTAVATTEIPDTTTAPATPEAPATAPPTVTAATPTTVAVTTGTAPPTTVPTTYSGIGGAITVEVADGRLALVGDPRPASGHGVEIQDNGPTRVRVRFDGPNRRTEIRVDLEGGQLVPRIDES